MSEEDIDSVAEQLAHLSFDGMQIQHFDLARDVEEAQEADHVSWKAKVFSTVTQIAPKMAVGSALGAITGAPGIVFGVSGAIAGKAADKFQERLKKSQGCNVTITAVRAADLKQNMKGPFGKRKMNPYVTAQVVLNGQIYKGPKGFNMTSFGKTPEFQSGGTDVHFPEGKHKTLVAFPMAGEEGAELAKTACLFLSVEDKPDILKGPPGSDFHCGSAVLYLGQLFETLQNEDLPDVEVPVNLQLSPQGALRVMVKVEL